MCAFCIPVSAPGPARGSLPARSLPSLQVQFCHVAPTPLSSIPYRLICTTASTQSFWNQCLPHTFHRDGGYTPSNPNFSLPSLCFPQFQSLSFHALMKCKFRNPFPLIFMQIGGGGIPLFLLPSSVPFIPFFFSFTYDLQLQTKCCFNTCPEDVHPPYYWSRQSAAANSPRVTFLRFCGFQGCTY
jgi:hypothetical protein